MGAVIKREFVSYFKNPIGSFMIGAYALLSGLCFILSVVINNTSYMGAYFGVWLYFVNVILVSLLSFRFFSEEKKNKTDQLLLTAPVSIYSLVLGKYISACAVFTIATIVNILYAFIVALFGTLQVGDFIMQFIGALLIGYAMIAVAVFISSLTESQIGTVAATFASLIFMFIVDTVAKFVPGVVSEILKSISLYSRYGDFSIGLFSIAPIVFYISISVVFLFLSVRSIEKRRWA